jgi:integrase
MIEDMHKAGYVPATVNTRLTHLKVLLRYAKKLDIVDYELTFPWAKSLPNARMRFLTEDEEGRILKLLDHWGQENITRLVSTLIDTGCRPSELINSIRNGAPIKWSEVSVSAGGTAPDVNDPSTGKPKAVISLMRTKTGQYRVLPLTDRARDAFLDSHRCGEVRPFGSLRADEVSRVFKRVVEHLGLMDCVLYTCRHTCASRLVQRGADLRRVMQWMGHTNINTTLRYAKLTPTYIFAIGDLL